MPKYAKILAETTAVFLWVFVIPTALSSSLNNTLVVHLPAGLAALLPYKWGLIGVLSVALWPIAGNSHYLTALIYVAIYPFIVLWRLTKFAVVRVMKSPGFWNVLTFSLLTVEGNAEAMRLGLIQITVILLAAAFVIWGAGQALYIGAIVLLLCWLVVHYYYRVRNALRPEITALERLEESLEKVMDSLQEDADAISESEDSFQSKDTASKRRYWIFISWLFTKVERVLDRLSKGHRLVGFYVMQLAYTVFMTVLLFGVIYYCLAQINPTSFSDAQGLGFVDLLYYSFATVFPAHPGDFAPANYWAMLLIGVEAFLSWMVLGLLFSRLALVGQRYGEQVRKIGEAFSEGFTEIKARVAEMHEMPLEELEAELDKQFSELTVIEVTPDEGREVADTTSAQAQLDYIEYMQTGAQLFRKAQQATERSDQVAQYREAASYFSAAYGVLQEHADVYDQVNSDPELGANAESAKLNEAYSLINAGDQEGAIAPMERYVDGSENVDADQYTLLGQLYLTNNRAGDAIPVLEEGADQYPDNSDIQSLLLNAYNSAGQTEQAIAAYQEQVENYPNNALYLYNLGSLLLNENRYDEAMTYLERAVEAEPNNANAQYNYGAAHVNKAVAINDRIAMMEDSLRANESELSESEIQELESTIQELAEERQQLFQDAIPPLERARQLAGSDSQNRRGICRALFSAYVQTEQQQKAEQVQECAGFDSPPSIKKAGMR